MREVINWQIMTEEQRNACIHNKVLGLFPMHCTDGQLDPYMGSYWGCTCGWRSDYHIGEGDSAHDIPIPAYSTSMDAAWRVVKAICHDEIIHSSDISDEFMQQLSSHHGKWGSVSFGPEEFVALTPERLCIAALKALGMEVQS